MTNNKKILILGGSGFLSGTLAKSALSYGHEVWTLSRGNKSICEDGRTVLIADRHDKEAFRAAILGAKTKWDAVIDCIGMTPDDAKQDIEVLSELTGHIIFVSTDFVYSPFDRKFPQGEETDSYIADGYGANKRQAELVFAGSDMGETVWTVVRPGHIYGPGSKLGCLPLHGRDEGLIDKLKEGKPISLVGGGRFLQQPIFAKDLSELMLSCIGNEATYNQIFCAGGPDMIESKKFYEIIADILGVGITIEEMPVDCYYKENPGSVSFLCHRIYDLTKLKQSGTKVPSTSIEDGLRTHVESLR